MKRILVIGSPGTGKTSFAKKLAVKTSLPLIHLDLYYHDKSKDYYLEGNKPAWYAKVDELIAEEDWIIDGNYNSTLEARVKRADTIFFFDLPRRTALNGVFRRRIAHSRTTRDDMPPDWEEHLAWGFLKYVWRYNKNKRPKVSAIIQAPKNKTVIVFNSRSESERYLNSG